MVSIQLPECIHKFVDWDCLYSGNEDRMRLAIALSRENVMRKTGGPFGAAVFERESGRLISVGVNSVVRLGNSTLHAEMVAFMMAQARLGRFSLSAADSCPYELVTSCEPCSMCLGAILWSGVTRVICGAAREDATQLGFEEGPVFPNLTVIWNNAALCLFCGCCARKPAKFWNCTAKPKDRFITPELSPFITSPSSYFPAKGEQFGWRRCALTAPSVERDEGIPPSTNKFCVVARLKPAAL